MHVTHLDDQIIALAPTNSHYPDSANTIQHPVSERSCPRLTLNILP